MAGRSPLLTPLVVTLCLLTASLPLIFSSAVAMHETVDAPDQVLEKQDLSGDVDVSTLEGCFEDRHASLEEGQEPSCQPPEKKAPETPECLAWDAWKGYASPDKAEAMLEDASDIAAVHVETETEETLHVSVEVEAFPEPSDVESLLEEEPTTPEDPLEGCEPEEDQGPDLPAKLPINGFSLDVTVGAADYEVQAYAWYSTETGDVHVGAYAFEDGEEIDPVPSPEPPEHGQGIPSNIDGDTDELTVLIPKDLLDDADPGQPVGIPEATSLVPDTDQVLDEFPDAPSAPDTPGLEYVLGTLPEEDPGVDDPLTPDQPSLSIRVDAADTELTTETGTVAHTTLHVSNDGPIDQEITLALEEEEDDWQATITPSELEVEAGSSQTAMLSMLASVDSEDQATFTVHAVSELGQEDTDEVLVNALTPPQEDDGAGDSSGSNGDASEDPPANEEGEPDQAGQGSEADEQGANSEQQEAPGVGVVASLLFATAAARLARRDR